MDDFTNEKLQKSKARKKFLLLFAVSFFFACLPFADFSSQNSPPLETTHPTEPISPPDVSTPQIDETVDVSTSQISPQSEDIYADYDFTKPVPVSTAVDLNYFHDAVFIGDSRTEGLILNLNLSQTTAYAQKGLMVNTTLTDAFIDLNGQKVTIPEALKQTEFSKVYIMLGINELGWAYSSRFIEKYGLIIDEIRTINPNSIIYIQSILPVSEEVSSTHSYIKNDKIVEYNTLLTQLAAEKQVLFVDTAAAVINENGCLPDDAATDGIHLKKNYCEKWLNYLQTHTLN